MKPISRVNGKIILGEGETTSHHHTIRERSARFFEVDADTRLLRLPKAALLRHERGDVPAEHRDIRLPSGEPCISYKRQYSPDGWTRVID